MYLVFLGSAKAYPKNVEPHSDPAWQQKQPDTADYKQEITHIQCTHIIYKLGKFSCLFEISRLVSGRAGVGVGEVV